jgi:hypothetical protein
MRNQMRRISFCPHCGNVAPQRLVFKHETNVKEIDAGGNVELAEPEDYYLVLCETCNEPLLYHVDVDTPYHEPYAPDADNDEELDRFYFAERLWPSLGIPPGLPEPVRLCYAEALRLKPVSPSAFAVQIRRGLEAMCDDRGAAKGHLEKRLKDLSSRGEIPPNLVEVTQVLRALGNVGAHDFDAKLNVRDANVINQFFRSIMEYVYVAPHSLKRYLDMVGTFGRKKDEPTPKDVDPEEPDGNERVVH